MTRLGHSLLVGPVWRLGKPRKIPEKTSLTAFLGQRTTGGFPQARGQQTEIRGGRWRIGVPHTSRGDPEDLSDAGRQAMEAKSAIPTIPSAASQACWDVPRRIPEPRHPWGCEDDHGESNIVMDASSPHALCFSLA